MTDGSWQEPATSISADDLFISRMLLDAELPPLLPALAFLTGDLGLVTDDLRPSLSGPAPNLAPQGGMSESQQVKARKLAHQAICQLRDGDGLSSDNCHLTVLPLLMRFLTGEVSESYLSMLRRELGLEHESGNRGWTKSALTPDRDFAVAVIGAGMSGLAAARRLYQAEIPFVVLERNDDVGGVWLENSYPGCRLDTNNFAYSYSFAQKADWPQQYSTRESIYSYFRTIADNLELRQYIRFQTEVTAADYDEGSSTWMVRYTDAEGVASAIRVQAVVSAVGQLNRPNYPVIPGNDRFVGESFHTARWNHSVDLKGRRVAVIGTGASGYQVIPSIVDDVAELHVFQRHAPWALPAPFYHADVTSGMQWLFGHIPYYHQWFRFYQFWIAVDGARALAVVDPLWQHQDSVSEANEALRQRLEQHIRTQYPDRPDLLAKVIPDYPPYAKRMLRDNGVWARTMKKPHVELVTERIVEITETGIRTDNGREHTVDVIVYATGFQASDFLAPMAIRGRDGIDLREQWNGDARAFLGITVPGFPNFFCLYGPNTNLVLSGSIVMYSEAATDYVLGCIHALLSGSYAAIECRREVYEAYNERINEANKLMAWGASDVSSWYKNGTGRVSQNWPLTTLEYWQLTRAPDLTHYIFS